MLNKIEAPLPINVAPLTGFVILPSSTRYPSLTAKLKSPVAGFTEPPPSDLAYRPNLVAAMISSFVEVPLSINVLDIRDVG